MGESLHDIMWLLFCTGLVLFMQAGFSCIESGLSRSKNSINVAIKNVVDLCLSSVLFWAFGFALMFGLPSSGWLGSPGFFFNHSDPSVVTTFLFQLVFCGTATTIASGAIAERMRFRTYVVLAALICGLIYPIFGHWVWGGSIGAERVGWLAQLGFIDFAGATVVHGVGAWSALAAIILIGPRRGRFDQERAASFHGHNLPLVALGVFILWFGWLGFNGGSTFAFNDQTPGILLRTTLGGAAGGLAVVMWQFSAERYVNAERCLNGVLAGLVGVTAGCHLFSTVAAVGVGAIAGLVCFAGSEFFEKRLKLDDVVSAVAVHGFAGVWGTLAVALLGPASAFSGNTRVEQLLVQFSGIATCCAWSFGVCFVGLRIAGRFAPLRVSEEEEDLGLNIAEHGATTELRHLVDVMQEHLKGNLAARAPADSFSEVGSISRCYNLVLDDVESKTIEVIRANEELTDARDSAVRAQHESEQALSQVQEFSRLSVGRELKMIELKEEVNELLERTGSSPKYRIDAANPECEPDGVEESSS